MGGNDPYEFPFIIIFIICFSFGGENTAEHHVPAIGALMDGCGSRLYPNVPDVLDISEFDRLKVDEYDGRKGSAIGISVATARSKNG